jgi:hypothetical protein
MSTIILTISNEIFLLKASIDHLTREQYHIVESIAQGAFEDNEGLEDKSVFDIAKWYADIISKVLSCSITFEKIDAEVTIK